MTGAGRTSACRIEFAGEFQTQARAMTVNIVHDRQDSSRQRAV